jgi:ketosteroid isomerase-like protein
MIDRLTTRIYRQGFDALERGDLDALLARFDERCTLTFVGDTPLGAHVEGRAAIRRWFERFGRMLPSPTFHVQHAVVSGPPWRQRLAAHVVIRSTVAGEPYENQFAHFLRLRWGRVVEDLVLEDTQRWARACDVLVAHGVAEAAEGPMRG